MKIIKNNDFNLTGIYIDAEILVMKDNLPEEKNRNKLFQLKSKIPIIPTQKELTLNRPSRSAKLRYAIKKINLINFEKDFLNKFSKLLEIENLSKKL